MFTRQTYRCMLLGMAIAYCAGCGGPTRHAVEGSVTLDGMPLSEARILFIPEASGLKKTGGVIKGGKYRLPSDVGLVPGVYQVQIVDDPPDADPDSVTPGQSTRRQLPDLYAAATPLRLEVNETGQGDFDFELQSIPIR